MNIFVTDLDPEKSAIVLDDIRANKLVLESAQMLSTAVRWWAEPKCTTKVYRMTHVNHPCSVWTRHSLENFTWLYNHALALMSVLGGYHHKSYPIIKASMEIAETSLPRRGQTKFANCARNNSLDLDFTFLSVPDSYRNYLVSRWETDTIKLTWKNRQAEKDRLVSKWRLLL